jgi:endonuclease/exonuclease/phosphatase family metal-dependent hydrolase
MPVDLSILSYNIHHGEGRDGCVNLQRLADIITSRSPDLVALQEVDRNKKRTGYVNQVAELSVRTGMEAAFSVSIDSGKSGQYGNMVLSRFPILHSETYPLPGEPRSLLEIHVEIANSANYAESILFYSTHLDLEQKPRLQSVQKIRRIVTSFPGRPVILAGDLNAEPNSPAILQLLMFMASATAGKVLETCANDGSGKNAQQIDYILYRPAFRWQVLETEVLDEPTASDHFPLLAQLRLV